MDKLNIDPFLLLKSLKSLYEKLDSDLQQNFDRSLPFGESISNRWERAKRLGFGKGSSIYDSSMVFMNVTVGKDCWIGPHTIIDGSGGLIIGNSCTLSAGVHIYTHDNVKQTLLGRSSSVLIEKAGVKIGNNTYLAPNVVVAKGLTIGNHCIIAVNSFVNKSVPNNSIMAGNPAVKIGEVKIEGMEIKLN